eukprot:365472-Chlamydomonas_euryale.AAC.3
MSMSSARHGELAIDRLQLREGTDSRAQLSGRPDGGLRASQDRPEIMAPAAGCSHNRLRVKQTPSSDSDSQAHGHHVHGSMREMSRWMRQHVA